ncbi:hypothetical protein HDE_11128 [Halotydeus destructor]|nr:hypothetical protein HDE_11128 [Halotydeus destructor]
MQCLAVLVAILSLLADGVPLDHESTLEQAEHGGESNFTGPVNQVELKCRTEVDVVFIIHSMMGDNEAKRLFSFSIYLSDTFGLNSSRIGFFHYSAHTYRTGYLSASVDHLKNSLNVSYSARTASSLSEAVKIFNEAEAQNGARSGRCFRVEGRSYANADRAAHRSVVNDIAAYAVHAMLLDVDDSVIMSLSLFHLYENSLYRVERLIGYKCEPHDQNFEDSGATGGDGASSPESIDVSNSTYVAYSPAEDNPLETSSPPYRT